MLPTASRRRDFCGNPICTTLLLDVRRHLAGEALEFCEQIRTAGPKEHFVFLVGPPAYLSLTWPDDVTAVEKKPQRWAETIKRFLAAA
jgi:hypothetical protein